MNSNLEEPRPCVDAKGLVTCMARRQRDDWQRKGLDAAVWIRMLAQMKLNSRRQKA